jgi:SAM-dependent methyltransferase
VPAYSFSAPIYDRIYSGKDYAGESRQIVRWIRQYGRARSRTLLDVACGSGNHLAHLSRRFEATGVDSEERMLRVARRKLPRARFVRGRMESFRLGRTFDAITCLFSAIGYVRSESELRRTIRNFARHLAPGGIAIVEPWLTRGQYRAGAVHARIYGTPKDPIVRMDVSARRGDRSILDLHHLIATRGGVRHWVERHDLGMFSVRTYLAAFRAAGFRARYRRRGFLRGRGIYLAVLSKRPRGRADVTRGSWSWRRPRGS